MEVRLYANATTTPKQRAYIQRLSRPADELAVEIGVSETTIRRWRARDTVQDRPHTPHRLATVLSERATATAERQFVGAAVSAWHAGKRDRYCAVQ